MEYGGWLGITREWRVGDEGGRWERLFGVGEGTNHQTIKKLTGQEYTMSP